MVEPPGKEATDKNEGIKKTNIIPISEKFNLLFCK